MSDTTTFEVSLPICTDNAMYSTTKQRKRVKSSEYRSWLHQAGWEYLVIRNDWMRKGGSIFTYAIPVSITIEVTDAVRKGNTPNPRDLTNHNKQAVDFLVKQGLLKDDDLVDECIMRWAPADEVKGMRLTIRPM